MVDLPLVVVLVCSREDCAFRGKVCRLKRVDTQTNIFTGTLGTSHWKGYCDREFGEPKCPDGAPPEPREPIPF